MSEFKGARCCEPGCDGAHAKEIPADYERCFCGHPRPCAEPPYFQIIRMIRDVKDRLYGRKSR